MIRNQNHDLIYRKTIRRQGSPKPSAIPFKTCRKAQNSAENTLIIGNGTRNSCQKYLLIAFTATTKANIRRRRSSENTFIRGILIETVRFRRQFFESLCNSGIYPSRKPCFREETRAQARSFLRKRCFQTSIRIKNYNIKKLFIPKIRFVRKNSGIIKDF